MDVFTYGLLKLSLSLFRGIFVETWIVFHPNTGSYFAVEGILAGGYCKTMGDAPFSRETLALGFEILRHQDLSP